MNMNLLDDVLKFMTQVTDLRRVGRHLLRRTLRRTVTSKHYGKGLTGPVVRVCPGGRHAWLQTSIGLIRKPYTPAA